MLRIRRSIALLACLSLLGIALPASAKPVSTYVADFDYSGGGGNVVVMFTDTAVSTVQWTDGCTHWISTTVLDSAVTVGKNLTESVVSGNAEFAVTGCGGDVSMATSNFRVSSLGVDRILRSRTETGDRVLDRPSAFGGVLGSGIPASGFGSLVETISRG